MTLEEFEHSLTGNEPPLGLSLPLKALWHDKKGDWEKAHDLAQQAANHEGSWVHAYLHRKEGDLENARYWYRRAGQNEARQSLEEEWRQLVDELLT
jgi:hypothetical protein